MPWIPDAIRGVSFNVVAINLTIQGENSMRSDRTGMIYSVGWRIINIQI